MSDVWFCIPSAKKPVDSRIFLEAWRDQGYKLAIQRDLGAESVEADRLVYCEYDGTAKSHNRLAFGVLTLHPEVNFVVFGGDDMYPDPKKRAHEVEQECLDHFGGTFGVMQPTGDRWMIDSQGLAGCERICGSPFVGREFAERANGGRGPCWPGFRHYFWDELLRETTIGKCLWQRRDLIHEHDHWTRRGAPRPDYLATAQKHWAADEALFRGLKTHGFPGSDPLPKFAELPAYGV